MMANDARFNDRKRTMKRLEITYKELMLLPSSTHWIVCENDVQVCVISAATRCVIVAEKCTQRLLLQLFIFQFKFSAFPGFLCLGDSSAIFCWWLPRENHLLTSIESVYKHFSFMCFLMYVYWFLFFFWKFVKLKFVPGNLCGNSFFGSNVVILSCFIHCRNVGMN